MRLSKFCYATLLMSGMAFADEPLDVTIRVVESPGDLPGAVTKTLQLPPQAAERARERSQPGLDRANEARARGRGFGQDVAEEAKNQGNRGNAGQGRGRGRP